MAYELLALLFLLAIASTRTRPPTLNVILMEGDLLTPETCEQVQKASMFPTSVDSMGAWFCIGSVLGRFVDNSTIERTEKVRLVHYTLRVRPGCDDVSFAHVRDVYIYDGYTKDGQTAMIQHTDDAAYASEFVQKAIATVEQMAHCMCSQQTNK